MRLHPASRLAAEHANNVTRISVGRSLEACTVAQNPLFQRSGPQDHGTIEGLDGGMATEAVEHRRGQAGELE